MRPYLLFFIAMSFVASAPALAQSRASGMVEDIKSAPQAGVQPMDFVFPGQKIALGASGEIVLSYFSSCQVETIRGGTVAVGQADSKVEGGAVQAQKRPCDPKKFAANTTRTAEAGAAVKRLDPFDQPGAEETALSATRPVFRWREEGGAMVRVFAVDTPTPKLVWQGKAEKSWVAYPADQPALQPGVPYLVQVVAGGKDMRANFLIDPGLNLADTVWNRTVLVRK